MSTETKYIREWLAEGEDTGDRWGSLLASGFAVCEAITHLGGEVPDEIGYRPSILGVNLDPEESWLTLEMIALVEAPGSVAVPGGPVIVLADLERVAQDLSAELDQVPEADRY